MTFEIIVTIISAIAWFFMIGLLLVLIWQVSDLQQLLREVLHELLLLRQTPQLTAPAPAMEIAPVLPADEPDIAEKPFWNDVSQLHGAMTRISETGEVPDHAILMSLSPNDAYHALADRVEELKNR